MVHTSMLMTRPGQTDTTGIQSDLTILHNVLVHTGGLYRFESSLPSHFNLDSAVNDSNAERFLMHCDASQCINDLCEYSRLLACFMQQCVYTGQLTNTGHNLAKTP